MFSNPSLKTKLAAAAAAIALLIGALAVVIVALARSAADGMEEAQEVGVGGALLGERIRFDVVQVQQWLTDISATRGRDGLDDGFDVAAEFAADFEVATGELEALRPELAPDVDELRSRFATYHAVGIEMAEAYIDGGPEEGNRMMGEFDAAAAAIGESVDVLVDELLAESDDSLDRAVGNAALVGQVTVVAGAALLLVVAGTGLLITRSVMGQLRTLTDTASRLAAGDTDVDPIPSHDRDPLGRLAIGFNEVSAMLGAVGSRAELIASGDITSSHRIPGALGRSFDSMIGGLGGVVDKLRNSASELTEAAGTLTGVAARVGDNVQETAREATSASASGDEVSSRVAMVASAIEEMNASIQEVSNSASEAARVASEAVGVARHTSTTIAKLGDSSEEVGNVIKVIHSIAEQTNLLALNATIEAARAGEAGKGFAVVATEVKELADQTAKATQEISERIEAIQADTNGAVEANARIGDTIDRINEISTTIASAVEEQSVTTSEISRNVEEAASSSKGIASSISGVATVAANTTGSAEETRTAAEDMRRLAEELTRLVSIYH